MLKCLRRILEMRGSAGLYVTINGDNLKKAGRASRNIVTPFVVT